MSISDIESRDEELVNQRKCFCNEIAFRKSGRWNFFFIAEKVFLGENTKLLKKKKKKLRGHMEWRYPSVEACNTSAKPGMPAENTYTG